MQCPLQSLFVWNALSPQCLPSFVVRHGGGSCLACLHYSSFCQYPHLPVTVLLEHADHHGLFLLLSGHFWASWSLCVLICLPLFVTGRCCLTGWPNRNGQTPALLVKGWKSFPLPLFVQLLLNVIVPVKLELSNKLSAVCGWACRAVRAYGFWSDYTWCSVMALVDFVSDWLQQRASQVCKGAAFQGNWCCKENRGEGGVTDFWTVL